MTPSGSKTPDSHTALKTFPVPDPRKLPRQLFNFFQSFGLAAAVLFLLTVITLLGTLNQAEESLYDSQKKYFESFWVVDQVGKFPVFLPGGVLLMGILFFNLVLGTVNRIRRTWKNAGLYTAHAGILILIVSAFVTSRYSQEGNMALYPGMESNEALSYHYWQFEIIPLDESGKAREALVIPHGDLRSIGSSGRTFTSTGLPFKVRVERYYRNCLPVPESVPVVAQGGPAVDGYRLVELPAAKEGEGNTAGLYVRFDPADSGEKPHEAIIHGHLGGNFAEHVPHTFTMGGRQFGAQLIRERMPVPFTVKLDQFIFQKYGGSRTAMNYQSNITKIEDGTSEKIEIKMNEPLRHRGYTFFQASFGPANAGPGEELYTQLAVVKNPSDHWPLASLLVVFAGLLFHLILKLADHLNRSSGSPRKPSAA